MIRSRCEQLDMMEDERVRAAISMSLCELATAKHHSIPMECASFTINQPSSTSTAGSQGECVSALSRSAQFWSSYSGYLREIPQLCFTFQRWNDIDVARDLYHNITLEKLMFIKLVQEREKEGKVNAETWKLGIAELFKTASYIRNVSQRLDARFELQGHEVNKNLLKAVNILERRVDTVLDKSLNALSGNFVVSLGTVVSNLGEGLRSRLEETLVTLHEQHQQLLVENTVPDIIWLVSDQS
ncbi:hypothetical protein E1B28_008360 [Marasmius oreades]|uniref:Uncharacterized protein n=1 Tax=Marasmius oreades TaxID=181124 RepID=A0A9P7RZF5_9AGAR|nr:uncharacterized protein E1B28_008360 [Marasmius oreades]KAG7091971.1 hypothetical protein E1B28_008360 [Marasmius oreades]